MKSLKSFFAIFVISFLILAVSCRGFFADITKSGSSEQKTPRITLPPLPALSQGNDICSVYALLCRSDINLNIELLRKMIVDGEERSELPEFKDAYALHKNDGLVEQKTWIDVPVTQTLDISFSNANRAGKYFIRILICQNGVIKYAGTSPDGVLSVGAGGRAIVNEENCFNPAERQNSLSLTIKPITFITYYVSASGSANAEVNTRENPTSLEKALEAIKTQENKSGANIVLIDSISKALDTSLLKEALANVGEITISSLEGKKESLTLPTNFDLLSTAPNVTLGLLHFSNVNLKAGGTIKTNGNLSLTNIDITASIESSGGLVTLNGTKLNGNITSTSGTVSLVNGANVSGSITGNDATISLNPNTVVSGTVTANGGKIQIGGNAKVGNKTSAIYLKVNDSKDKFGCIEIISHIEPADIIPIHIENYATKYNPYQENPIILGQINEELQNIFSFDFLIAGFWGFEPVYNDGKVNFFVRDNSANPNENVTNIWLFENMIDLTSNYETMVYNRNNLICTSLDYNLIDLNANSTFHDTFDISTDNQLSFICNYFEQGEEQTSIFRNQSQETTGYDYSVVDYNDIYPQLSKVYDLYSVDSSDFYALIRSDKIIMNKLTYKYDNTREKYTFTTYSDYQATSELQNLIKGFSSIYFCIRSDNSKAYLVGENALYEAIFDSKSNALTKGNISNLEMLNGTKVHDITYHNNAVYILAGQVTSTGTIYSRGAVIKVDVSGTSMNIVGTYGLANDNTAEHDETNNFYNPVRFLGVRDNDLIIADDGRTERGIQKNRVVFFDMTTNKIKETYYTDAEFLNVY